MTPHESCSSGQGFLVRDIAKFPINLGPFFAGYSEKGTLRNVLVAALALAHEKNTGCVIRFGSDMHFTISKFLDGLIPFTPSHKGGKTS